jgi:cysteine desulfurase
MSKLIYLDYAAATPVDERVMDAMRPYFSDMFYNPSALYSGARQAKKALDEARSKTAQLIGAKPSEIIFTAGGTESANMAVHGVMKAHPDGQIMISSVEHDAVLKPAENYTCTVLPVDDKGRVNPQSVIDNCTDNTVLVSVMLANNEIGTLQPIKEIADCVEKIRQNRRKNNSKTPIYLHVDACQAPLYLDVNVARLKVDLMTLNGGKMYGPKQSGILYIKAGVIIQPTIEGGGQEWGYRSGTENVAFAIGFAKALELADRGRANRAKEMVHLRDYFMRELEKRFKAEITGHRKHRLAQNVHAIFPDIDNERVLFALDDAGVWAAAGSACSASSEVASHVLLAIGKKETEAQRSIRFSFGKTTTKDELDQVLKHLEKALVA